MKHAQRKEAREFLCTLLYTYLIVFLYIEEQKSLCIYNSKLYFGDLWSMKYIESFKEKQSVYKNLKFILFFKRKDFFKNKTQHNSFTFVYFEVKNTIIKAAGNLILKCSFKCFFKNLFRAKLPLRERKGGRTVSQMFL